MITLWPFGRTREKKLAALDAVMVEQKKAFNRLQRNLTREQGDRLNELLMKALPKFDEKKPEGDQG